MLKPLVRVALAVGSIAIVAGAVRADDRQIQIKASIDRAVQYLKANYRTSGGAESGPMAAGAGLAGQSSSGWDEGPAALAGIALLEAGVKADDPAIVDISKIVRAACIKQNQTYVLSLDILYLDKLGEQIDTTLIQAMGIQLIKGQNNRGGWSYMCPNLPADDQARLRNALGAAIMKGGKELPQVGASLDSRPRLDPDNEKLLKNLPRGQDTGMDDNSNTQFAAIALFAARRHGVPVEATGSLRAVENRFRQIVDLRDGGWSYTSQGFKISTAPMTCAGLIALAVGKGMKRETSMKSKGQVGSDGKLTIDPSKGGAGGGNEPDPLKDPQVQKALHFVVACCKASGQRGGGAGPGPMGGPGPVGGPMGGGGGPAGTLGSELRNNLYFMWSLERVCAVFGLNDINGFDWHKWGADALIKSQGVDGSWYSARLGQSGYSSNATVDTAFGLMFMTKANIVKDLTKLLKSGDPEKIKGSEPRANGSGNIPKPPDKPANPTGPAIVKDNEAAALTDALVKAGPSEQEVLIKRYESMKGTPYSQALGDAIAKLKGDLQEMARDALFQRMCRMSANTLKAWIKDDNAELRRAAALAMCRRDEVEEMKSLVPNLIEALDDPEEIVWRAAGVSLREIAKKIPGGTDAASLGPRKDDSEAKRKKAISEWKIWYEKHKG